MVAKPRLFISSATEGLEVAYQIQLRVKPAEEVTVWEHGFFPPGCTPLETLIARLDEFDFAVIILSPHGRTVSRGSLHTTPADNVIFELGLFMGRLGPRRTFILYEDGTDIKLPSDIAGVTVLRYERDKDSYFVDTTCTTIRGVIRELGNLKRPNRLDPTARSQDDIRTELMLRAEPFEHVSLPAMVCEPGQEEHVALMQVLDPDHHLDGSPLFIALLRVLPGSCSKAKTRLLDWRESQSQITVDGVYDLFGLYDLLVKIRAPNCPYKDVKNALVKHLAADHFLGVARPDGRYKLDPVLIDVAEEYYRVQSEMLQTSPKQGITAFVRIVGLQSDADVIQAFEKCKTIKKDHGPRAEIVGAYLAHTELILQLYLTCGGYYSLTKIIYALESDLESICHSADRMTVLAM